METNVIFIFGTFVLLLVLFGVWLSAREFNKMDKNPQQYRQPEQNERM
jgi:cbb3-type cytochrome oxidase subunit 3